MSLLGRLALVRDLLLWEGVASTQAPLTKDWLLGLVLPECPAVWFPLWCGTQRGGSDEVFRRAAKGTLRPLRLREGSL